MSKVHIEPVTTRRQRKTFLQLPWKLYCNDPHWIPPLRMNQAELVGYRRHPFYEDAAVQTFLAFDQGEACGRIAAIDNFAFNRTYPDQPRGCLGFFESVDRQDVATALFDAAREWLSDRNLQDLRGPVNPSLNHECGLLIQNFEMPPTFMMPYNPSYYQALWENYGFTKAQDLMTFVGYKRDLDTLEKKVHFVAKEARSRFNIQLRHIDKKNFVEDVRQFLRIYNASLEGNWGHVPMSEREIDHVSKSLRHLIIPELTLMAEVDGQAAGCIFGLLDYNPRVKAIDGRLFPFGFIKLLSKRQNIKRVRLVSTNVLPQYQRWGVGVVLAANLLPSALRYGVEEGEFSWVLESNHLSRKTLERGKLHLEKMHRIYDLITA